MYDKNELRGSGGGAPSEKKNPLGIPSGNDSLPPKLAGNGEWGIGNGEWGMAGSLFLFGEWGMGNEISYIGNGEW